MPATCPAPHPRNVWRIRRTPTQDRHTQTGTSHPLDTPSHGLVKCGVPHTTAAPRQGNTRRTTSAGLSTLTADPLRRDGFVTG